MTAFSIAAIGVSILIAALGIQAVGIMFDQARSVDFLSFWSAGHLAASGRPADAYAIGVHRMIEATVAPIRGLLPFPYPPMFLFLIVPLGLLPYPVAFAAWLSATYALFAAGAQRDGGGRLLPFALSQPAVLANLLVGQTGLLLSGILWSGLNLIAARPFLGGAILGLMVLKPQLALLVPLALIAGREWRAFAGAAASAAFATLFALATFGPATFDAFLQILRLYAQWVSASRWPWNELASLFAFLRFFGLPTTVALAIHASVALAAIALMVRAWKDRHPQRGAILACSILLVPPYLFTYDTAFLAIAAVALMRDRRNWWIATAMWALAVLPVAVYFRIYDGPTTAPFAAMIGLWALFSRASATAGPASVATGRRATSRPAAALDRSRISPTAD